MGVKQDYTKAVEWYEKAAEQGDSDGQTNLGRHYYIGMGVAQDFHEAFKWFKKAAEHEGVFGASAQYYLGCMYYNGEGVRQDYTLAKEFFGKACDNGDQDGCDRYKELNLKGY